MEKNNIKRLEELSLAMGVSSLEKPVAKYLKEQYLKNVDEIMKDRLGSVYAVKRSKNPNAKTLLIASSLDEIGLMVSSVNKNGTLSFIALEALSPASLLHQRIKVYTRSNEVLIGVISANVNAMSSLESVKMDQLYIDLGSKEQADRCLPGDLVMIDGGFDVIDQHIAVGKALNQRVMLEAGLQILENLKDEDLDYNLVVGGIAASIVGCRGTMTTSYVVKPDCALILCGFDANNSKCDIQRGKGTVLAYHDAGMLPSQRLLSDLTSYIKDHQTSVGTSANDSSFIHKMLKGCPSVAMGVALNNCGSPNVMVDLCDVDGVVKQVCEYCRTLTSDKINYFGFGDESYEH